MLKILGVVVLIVLVVLVVGVVFVYFQLRAEKEVIQIGNLKLTSSSFQENEEIPDKHTCRGENVNPLLNFSDVSEGTKSFVLIVDDPDASLGTWVHWVVWNIPAETRKIEENSVPQGALQGVNDFGDNKYGGPCPPFGTHRYIFKLYALDTMLDLDENSGKRDVEAAMQGHILAQTKLIGLSSKE